MPRVNRTEICAADKIQVFHIVNRCVRRTLLCICIVWTKCRDVPRFLCLFVFFVASKTRAARGLFSSHKETREDTKSTKNVPDDCATIVPCTVNLNVALIRGRKKTNLPGLNTIDGWPLRAPGHFNWIFQRTRVTKLDPASETRGTIKVGLLAPVHLQGGLSTTPKLIAPLFDRLGIAGAPGPTRFAVAFAE